MTEIAQLGFNAMSVAALYALVAVGVTLIFGLTGIVNFAHGQLLMLGAFVTYALTSRQVGFYWAIGAAFVSMAAVGLALERGLFRFTLREPITGFIVSLGLIPVFEVIAIRIWGTDAKSVFPPLTGSWETGGVFLPIQRVFIIGLTAAVMGGLFAFLKYTHTGRSLRAAAEDREMAAILGVNVRTLIGATFALGSALAGLAGALVVSALPVTPYTGGDFVFFGFAVALIGGLGSPLGAVLAAVALALAQTFFARYISPAGSDGYVYIVMIFLLLLRPQGLVRGTEGSRVI